LVNVIKHLRKELVTKEDRIRHLELYIDKLVNKVLVTNPELLQASSSPKKLPTIQKPLPTITEPVKPKIILSARMH
jgi:hypothetical protein